jgi:antitoxin component YwqK of YwqJK toxin-antitoxin module
MTGDFYLGIGGTLIIMVFMICADAILKDHKYHNNLRSTLYNHWTYIIMPMLRLLLICLSFGIASAAHACLCDIRPLKEYIEHYPFIAHVRVTQKLDGRDLLRKGLSLNEYIKIAPVLKIEIIELFKGSDSLKAITEYDVYSSCAIGVRAGEEWIIFAAYDENKRIFYIEACNPSASYRNTRGERWWHDGYEGLLINLRTHFNHPPPDSGYNGLHKSFYGNGETEWEASYTNGQLDGSRKIYYANGSLHIDEQFVNGQPHGWHKKYYKSGCLHEEILYKNGKRIQSKEWGHPSNRDRYRGLYQEFYYRDSTYSIQKKYDENGRLKEETEYNDSADMYEKRQYYPSGQLEYRSTTWRREKRTIQLFWKEDGTLEKKRKYIDDKLIED